MMQLLEANFKKVAERLRKDYDWMHGNVGYEGSGKTTIGWLICKIIDPEFTAKNVAFTFDQLIMLIEQLPKYSAIMVDEGAEIFFNLNTTSREGKEITKKLTQIRSKNLFILINIPDFTLLQKYIKNHRLLSLTRVISRGVCEFHSKNNLFKIKLNPQTKKIEYPKPSFYDRFPKVEGEEWNEYLKKKDTFLGQENSTKVIREKLKRLKKLSNTFTFAQVASIWNKPINSVKFMFYNGVGADKYRIFRKQDSAIDFLGRVVISKKGVKLAEKKLEYYHNFKNKRREMKKQHDLLKKKEGKKKCINTNVNVEKTTI